MAASRPFYPSARRWKFDFHAHTPASTGWQGSAAVLPESWLLAFMTAEIDGVVITDYNCGAWIHEPKHVYAMTKADEDRRAGLPGPRDLILFPGIEISA